MYNAFYGFTCPPFALTVDPQFLYPSENYQDCLFYLLSGLAQDQGVLVLTGESGTGKTFLLHTVVKSLDEKTPVAYVGHANLHALEILHYASRQWGLEIPGPSTAALLLHCSNFLRTQAMNNAKVILIIDEAHHLSVDVLKELQLLTNFEDPTQICLHIILAGHVQLEETLKRPELRPWSQRIGANCRLLPLNVHETQCYIAHRLAVAGVTDPVFTSQAMREIFVRSKGIPRVINLICHVALLLGFNDDNRVIGRTIIKQVMQGLNLYTTEKPRRPHSHHRRDAHGGQAHGVRRPRRLTLAAGIAAFSLLGAGVVLQGSLAHRTLRESTTRTGSRHAVGVPPSPAWREQPLLPPSPAWREQPLLPPGTSKW